VVTKQSASRVHILYQEWDGCQVTKAKQPVSLVLLEAGLHVVQDANGFVWVK
jgi:hypothetical protein